MKRILLFPLAAFLTCSAVHAESTPSSGVRDVWLYLPFDGSLDSLVPFDGLRKSSFTSLSNKPPEFVEGINGKALHVTAADQTQFSFVHGRRDFPMERGSTVIWIRPERDVAEQQNFWVYAGGWASFDLLQSGGRLLSYVTGESQHFVVGDMPKPPAPWKNQWHLIVTTWDGPKRMLYLNGKLIAERSETVPLKVAPVEMAVGYLPGSGDRSSSAFLDGAVDDLAILKAPLDAATVAAIFANGKQGFLGALGGGVLGGLPRKGYVRGEKTTLRVAPYADGDAIRVSAIPESGTPVKVAQLPCRLTDLSVDTTQLRPGRYRLRLDVLKGGKVIVSDDATTIGIRGRQFDEFPLGMSGIANLPDSTLTLLSEWGVSLSAGGGMKPDCLDRDLDRLYYLGLGQQVGLNLYWHKWLRPYIENPERYFNGSDENEAGTKEMLQWMAYTDDGSLMGTSQLSPFSPIARKGMLNELRAVVEAARGHPGLHSISFQDEYALRGGSKDGRLFIGDYNQHALAFFKEKSGLKEVPLPPKDPPGTIFPDNHPFLKWKDTIGLPNDASGPGMAMNAAEQTALVHQLRPDVLTTMWSGGEYGECDAVMDYCYPTIWQPHAGYEIGQARHDFIFDRHRGRQRVAPLKPVWGLTGWWSGDMSEQPDWCLQDFRLNNIMTLAKGARLMIWFSADPPDVLKPGQLGGGQLSRPDLLKETERWAKWIHQYGGMFARLEARTARRVAVLVSEVDAAGKKTTPSDYSIFYPAMRLAGIPVDVITDEKVLDGTLDQYEALAMFNIGYTCESLWKKIQQFAATPGKVVFCDQSTAPALRPQRAVLLNCHVFEEVAPKPGQPRMEIVMASLLRDAQLIRQEALPHLKPDALQLTGSDYVAGHWLDGGEGRFLALVNYNLYGSESAIVTLADVRGVVYDLETRQLVAETKTDAALRWKADGFEKAGWKTYVLLPRKISKTSLEAKMADGKFDVRVRVLGEDGKPLRAAIPIMIEFKDSGGKTVKAYMTHTALDPATGVARILIPRARLMDDEGQWTVIATELVSGKVAEVRFKVPVVTSISPRDSR